MVSGEEPCSGCWTPVTHRLIVPWTWFCGGDLVPFKTDTSCSCIRNLMMNDISKISAHIQPTVCLRQALVCFTQVLLILAFYIFFAIFHSTLPGILSRSEVLQAFEIGSILYNVTAVLSGLVGMSFLSSCIWVIVTTGALPPHTWVSLMVQGVAWITIAFSLRIRLRNPTKQVAYIWWILTFLLTTVTFFLATLDFVTEATMLSVEVFIVIASWPVSCLLLTCAINGERWIMVEEFEVLTEPLSDSRTVHIITTREAP